MGSLVGGVSLMLLPPSEDLVNVALPTAGEEAPSEVRFFVEGVSKIDSRPLGLEDVTVTGSFTALGRCSELELVALAAAGLESHPSRLFCFFLSLWS
jgi:hypothetical protein